MDVWQDTLAELQSSVPSGTFSAFFRRSELIRQNDDHISVGVLNVFAKTQLEGKYNGQVKKSLKERGINSVDFQIMGHTSKKSVAESRDDTASLVEAKTSVKRAVDRPLNTGLNERYTFESFIVGGCNDLAYSVCESVAKNPGGSNKYNPLSIYGGSGLGKTHLIQAVGNEILKNNPSAKVLYISTDEFYKGFVEAAREKKNFSDRFKAVDVLIIDDIQIIQGKDKSQEEFFNIFNTLHQRNKQIIISSDRPPEEIPTLSDRLRTRLVGGMPVDIQLPDFETRCAILMAKAEMSGVHLKSEVAEYIADKVKSSIRELEGRLNQLLAFADMRNIEPDIATAEGLMIGSGHAHVSHKLTAKQIIAATASYFQLTSADLLAPGQSKDLCRARHIAVYLLKTELNLSFPKVAHELGRKDHTTAMSGYKKIAKASVDDYEVKAQLSGIKDKLYVG